MIVFNEDLEIMIEMDAVFAISEYGKKLDMVMPIVGWKLSGNWVT